MGVAISLSPVSVSPRGIPAYAIGRDIESVISFCLLNMSKAQAQAQAQLVFCVFQPQVLWSTHGVWLVCLRIIYDPCHLLQLHQG